ncbi:MAG: hypothetical protein D6824_01125 [Planctomycetota bacterium]|nr:MAG: hypothetical protein D6824_01125 [Planctomycetota bacterium]
MSASAPLADALTQRAVPLQPSLDAAGERSLLAAAGPFANALARAQAASPLGDAAQLSPREAAEELVAQALVKPVLASLRETNQAAAPFAPTAAEKQFAPLLDAIFAQRIVASERFPLVDAVEASLSRTTNEAPA